MPVRGRRLTSASQGEVDFSAAATNTGVDRLGRIEYSISGVAKSTTKRLGSRSISPSP
jgi:hypothetical protein